MRSSTSPAPDGRHEGGSSGAEAAAVDARFVFGPRVRALAVGWAVAVVAGVVLVAPHHPDARAYVQAMAVISCLVSVPGVLIAVRAARRAAPRDRPLWWCWVGSFVVGCAVGMRLAPMGDGVWQEVQDRAVPGAVIGVVLLVGSTTLMLRSRSGRRDVVVDVADLTLAIVAVVAPLVILVGDRVISAPASWFTVSSAAWVVGALYGTGVALLLARRLRPGDQRVARVAVCFGVIAVVAAVAQVAVGVADFRWWSAPFLATYAASWGWFVVFLAHSTRRSSAGLERLPARAQVRRRPPVAVLVAVLVSIAVSGALVWARRGDEWPVVVALVAAGGLVVALCVRSLAASHETAALYRDVERSADERAALLSDVLARRDAERHRAAAHLHRQSAELYAALATATAPIGGADGPVAARVAERLRSDLGRQSDELGRLAAAVHPGRGDDSGPALATSVRAVLDGAYPEGQAPEVAVAVDPDLRLPWTDEAVLTRIAEHAAATLARRTPEARSARLGLAIEADELVLELALAGARDAVPAGPRGAATRPAGGGRAALTVVARGDDDELSPVLSGADLLGAGVERWAEDGELGLRVRVPRPGPPPPARPDLRVVDRP